jgi:hypothetical protein
MALGFSPGEWPVCPILRPHRERIFVDILSNGEQLADELTWMLV